MADGTEAASQDQAPDAGSRGLGWLDWAGIVAAGLLAVILLDIWTDGRVVSARLTRWRARGGDDVPEQRGD
jgi:hypothetical protein